MRMRDGRHSYDLIFDRRALDRTVSFQAYDRSAVFSDRNRIGGKFEIFEDGLRIASATYSPAGKFWIIEE
ncbi:hypothetical protein [Qipengyuania spongiae]|uniref:Uncharacterized protein n=1 Tax=Qipengyuania spongiae TaxID=2909673 RepID=A0ABY5SUA6_9SPHN|nr:hypothetical protein [Qipengyuania spongiae]UVI38160.1 hypothetical protein L1F33_07695 [Qipengyuania spongiae]